MPISAWARPGRADRRNYEPGADGRASRPELAAHRPQAKRSARLGGARLETYDFFRDFGMVTIAAIGCAHTLATTGARFENDHHLVLKVRQPAVTLVEGASSSRRRLYVFLGVEAVDVGDRIDYQPILFGRSRPPPALQCEVAESNGRSRGLAVPVKIDSPELIAPRRLIRPRM